MSDKKLKILNLFILDKSSSMGSIKPTIIDGFNEQIRSIQDLDKEAGTESSFGFITFDSGVSIRYLNQSIDTVELLNNGNYIPSGMTAFYDALGMGIKALEDKLGSELPNTKVLVTVLTDGCENASRNYTGSQIADLIQQYQNDYGWTFSFIGANIDVEQLAKSLNVSTSNTLNFTATHEGTTVAYDTLKMARSSYYTRSLNGEDVSKSFFQDDQEQK